MNAGKILQISSTYLICGCTCIWTMKLMLINPKYNNIAIVIWYATKKRGYVSCKNTDIKKHIYTLSVKRNCFTTCWRKSLVWAPETPYFFTPDLSLQTPTHRDNNLPAVRQPWLSVYGQDVWGSEEREREKVCVLFTINTSLVLGGGGRFFCVQSFK